MRVLLFLFLSLFTSLAHSSEIDFTVGNEAYEKGNYEAALTAYTKIIANDKMSAKLYYNLGNTYYKLNELGNAIWAYERALKINPAAENVEYNLALANTQTYDELDTSRSGIAHWLTINLFQFSINFWSYISLICSLILGIALYFYFTTNIQKTKNRSLNSGLILSFLTILTFVFAHLNKRQIMDRDEAIIIAEVIDLRPSPSETSPSAFQLHEGTKVRLLRSNTDWIEVDINGNTGWVQKEVVAKI